MGWKFEVFKYRKMETKDVPFGYLEFSHAIGRIPCPHMRTHAPSLAAAGRRRRRRGARARVWVRYPVRFFLNRVSRVWVTRILPAPLSGSYRTAPRNGCQPTAADGWAVAAVEMNHCNGSDRTVATVRFGPFYPSRRAINSAPFSQIRTHQHQPSVLSSEVRFSLSLCVS